MAVRRGFGPPGEESGAVLKALLPISLGHAASIGSVVIFLGIARGMLPEETLRWLCGGGLVAFGLYRLFRSRHPHWVGMRVGFTDLTLWSFLMASAHGAGLMLVPIFLQWPSHEYAHHRLVQALSPKEILSTPALLVAAVGAHTVSMLLATGAVALLVYEKLGLALLRRTWFNIDLLWALALLVAGAISATL